MSNPLRWAVALLAMFVAHGTAVASQKSAQEIVRQTTDTVLQTIKEDPTITGEPRRLLELVDRTVLPHFDFERMSKRVLGRHWGTATPEQRDTFVGHFRTLLVRTYATALSEYRDQSIEYLDTREQPEPNEVEVRTQIVRTSGTPIPISYKMYEGGLGWKVYDVAIDGISLVINYRSSFSSEIRRSGFDALNARLYKHNEDLMAGN